MLRTGSGGCGKGTAGTAPTKLVALAGQLWHDWGGPWLTGRVDISRWQQRTRTHELDIYDATDGMYLHAPSVAAGAHVP